MAKKNLTATSVAALTDIGKGELVELPGWTDDKPFVARLRRASLTGMIRAVSYTHLDVYKRQVSDSWVLRVVNEKQLFGQMNLSLIHI